MAQEQQSPPPPTERPDVESVGGPLYATGDETKWKNK